MIDLTKLDAPTFDVPEEKESARNDIPPRVIGPVTYKRLPVKYAYRRAYSEQQLEDIFRKRRLMLPGDCILFLTRGDVDLVSFLKIIASMQYIAELGVATFSANPLDVAPIRQLHDDEKIGSVDFYLGPVFQSGKSEDRDISIIADILKGDEDLTFRIIKNHAKVIFGRGKNFPFVITGSANLNTNYNIEAVTLIIDLETYVFCKEFFASAEPIQ